MNDVVVDNLRNLVPKRPLTLIEGFQAAERQASFLLLSSGIHEPPVPETIITNLSCLRVERTSPWPTSGASQKGKRGWTIVLNGSEPKQRQRFTLSHEFKHVLDDAYEEFLYPAVELQSSYERAEIAADRFAACLLMPRVWVQRAWSVEQIRDVHRLALEFNVSKQAMQIRLLGLGLVEPYPRCLVARA